MQIADLVENPALKREIKSILKEPAWHVEFLMTRTPLKKLKKSNKGVLTYFSLFWVTYLLNILVAGHSDYFMFYLSTFFFIMD